MLTEIYILEPDPIVRVDLMELASLELRIPRVETVKDKEFAPKILLSAGPSSCILVSAELAMDEGQVGPALIAAATRGAEIVVLGPERILPFPAKFVDVPFSSEMVIAAISGLQTDDTGQAAPPDGPAEKCGPV